MASSQRHPYEIYHASSPIILLSIFLNCIELMQHTFRNKAFCLPLFVPCRASSGRGNANAFGVPVGFLPLAHRLRSSSPVVSTMRGSRSASPPSISHVRLPPVSFSFLAPFLPACLPAWIHFSRGVSPDSAVRVFGAPRG